MAYIRLVLPIHYDFSRNRFQTVAFNPVGSGISVIDEECIAKQGHTICEHIELFYPRNTDIPAIYFRITRAQLPEICEFVRSPSPNGDDCHYDIKGLEKGPRKRYARKMFENKELKDYTICANGDERELVLDDIKQAN